MVVHVPPTAPSPLSQVPTRPPELTKEQFSKLSALLSHLNAPAFALPLTVKEVKAAQKARQKRDKSADAWVGKPLDGEGRAEKLSDREKCWLSSEQVQRFLRAVKWDLPAAFCRTEETLVWRREYGVDTLSAQPDMIDEEARTGKEVVLGWDVQKRPCLYMFPWRQNTKVSPRQIQFVVWTLERTVDLMGPNVEKLCLLIDFGTGTSSQPTSLGQAKKVLDILQNYYCERLGRAVCINVPTLFWGFYRLVSPFVDPVTKDKIRFNPDVRTLVPPEQLDKEVFGGDYDFIYKHDEYFPFLDKLCRERRDAQFARWQRFGGGKAGLSEFIIKGGIEEAQALERANDDKAAAELRAAGAAGAAVPSALPDHLAAPVKRSASFAGSDKSAGYVLPPEADSAPDWHESPDPSETGTPAPGRSRNGTNASAASASASSANGAPGARSIGMAARQSTESGDSFHSTGDEFHTPAANVNVTPAGERDPLADSLTSTSSTLSSSGVKTPTAPAENGTQDIQTGIKGLVIHPDGSVGAA